MKDSGAKKAKRAAFGRKEKSIHRNEARDNREKQDDWAWLLTSLPPTNHVKQTKISSASFYDIFQG